LVAKVPCSFPMPNQEGTTTDTSQLLADAQAAYEQKRLRECIALTKELIAADPGNAEAQALHQAIRDEIQQDVHDARTLIEQSGSPDEKKKYRKAAEIILIKTVQLDPDNAEAKALLQSARAVPGLQAPNPPQPPPPPQPQPQAQVQQPQPQTAAPAQHQPQPQQQTHHQPQHQSQAVREELAFTAGPVLFKGLGNEKKKGLKIPLGLILVLVGGVVVFKFIQAHQPSRTTLAATSNRTEPANSGFRPVSANPTDASSLIPSTPATTPALPAALAATSAPTPAAPTPTVPPAAAAAAPAPAPPAPPTAPAMGSLAVSSPTPAEIYQGGKLIGSTPTTLQLPAGRQTLEYRHGEMRTVVNHDIKANTTTAASVTFQTNVQINAKPWAQVFLDGTPRRALGQTPLSNVSVPIGGVLTFENPNFATKSYRITEKDTAIQVDFQ
jgi:hypothetical protein